VSVKQNNTKTAFLKSQNKVCLLIKMTLETDIRKTKKMNGFDRLKDKLENMANGSGKDKKPEDETQVIQKRKITGLDVFSAGEEIFKLKNGDTKKKTNGLGVFDAGQKRTTQIIIEARKQTEIEKQKLFKNLIWDAPYNRYGERYTGIIKENFTEKDAKDYFGLLNKIRIHMDTYGSVRLCITEHLSNGDMSEASRKFLFDTMHSLIGSCEFNLKNEQARGKAGLEDGVAFEVLLRKLKRRALDTAIKSFKSRNEYLSKGEIEKICQEGEYAHQVFEDSMEECSGWFEYRFSKIFKRFENDPGKGPDPTKAYHKLMHSDKIKRFVKPVETMAELKGYISDILEETAKLA
jgi:hypothetical protein